MNKPKFGYGWAVKWILAAILIAAGILMLLLGNEIVFAVSGITIVFFSIFRVVPLMKTLKAEALRTINLFEIFFDFVIGGLMLFVVFSGNANDAFWGGLYGYLLAFVLFARGLVFFASSFYFQEKSESLKFWAHYVFASLAPAILVMTIMGTNIQKALSLIVMLIAIGGGVYLGWDGFGGYRKYRESSKALNEDKKETKKPIVEKELPKPVPEEEKKEETYVN